MRPWLLPVVVVACAEPTPEVATTQQAGTITNIPASADTSINGSFVANNNGGAPQLFTGNDSQGSVLRSLVRFDMPSTYPGFTNRATITSAAFSLQVDPNFFGDLELASVGTLTAYPLAQAWAEGAGAGLVHVPTGSACSVDGGATWETTDCATAWTNNGGTVLAVPGVVANVTDLSDQAVVTFSNGQLIATVQSWIDDGNNFGWRLNSDTEAYPAFYDHLQSFYSRESAFGPKLSIGYTCKSGFTDTGSGCTSCTTAAKAACITTDALNMPTGNTCNDPGAPATSYTCSCVTGWSGTGTTACTDTDACTPNACDDNGDTSSVCNDHAAPDPGYDCTCSTGFVSTGGATPTCVNLDECTPTNHCRDNNDTTAVCTDHPAPQTGWDCTCDTGWISSGGATPTCDNFDACAATGNTACATAASGNSCSDDTPPSTGYACTCNASGYVLDTSGAAPACVNANACATNHCDDNGDAGALCIDDAPPGTGYSCTCTTGYAFDGTTCSNIDSCATNHCDDHGDALSTCVDLAPPSTTYSCTCSAAYHFDGTSCVDIDACDTAARARCAAQLFGNRCVDSSFGPGYTCECGAVGYTDGTVDGQPACVDAPGCLQNPCDDGGDHLATCTDHELPAGGYDCACTPGWTLGMHAGHATCIDLDECSAASNPCGVGTCVNIDSGGGYECECNPGFHSTGGVAAVCERDVGEIGNCSVAADPRAPIAFVLLGLAFARRRRPTVLQRRTLCRRSRDPQ